MKTLSDQDTFNLIKSLIGIPSLSSEEDKAAGFLEHYLTDVFGAKISRRGNNVIVKLGAENAKHTLLLCSHIDTVQPAANWTKDPYTATVEEGRIYGLGANDALASVVSMIAAASRVQDLIGGDAGITLGLVAEEEKGDQGFYTIEKDLHYTSAIFGEPTDLWIGTAMRGYMQVKVKGAGKSCHASRPWEGRNAILDLVDQLRKIADLDLTDASFWGRATMEPTVLNAGKSTNQIPDAAEAILDIRPTATVNNEKILSLLDSVGARYEVIHNRRRAVQCDGDSEVMRAVKAAHKDAEEFGFGGTCDMAFATKPSIVAGPGKSVRSHAADEYIEEAELSAGIRFYEEILRSYTGMFA